MQDDHLSKLERSEEIATAAILDKYPGYKVAKTKKIVSFDNVVYLFWLDAEKGDNPQKRAVVRFPRKNPATRPKQHHPQRQAWVCKQWRDIGKNNN